MKIKDILNEKKMDLTTSPRNPELKIPIATNKFDYGSASKALEKRDAILKASDTNVIYGRRQIVQRVLKPKKVK